MKFRGFDERYADELPKHRGRHRVRDVVQAPIAQFAAGHTVRIHDESLSVFAPDGTHRATFPSAAYRAAIGTEGELSIFPKGSARTSDARLTEMRDALVRVNKKNAEFWASRNELPENGRTGKGDNRMSNAQDGAPHRPHGDRLKALNHRHAEFYGRAE